MSNKRRANSLPSVGGKFVITVGYYDEIPQTFDSTLVINGLAVDTDTTKDADKLEVNYGCGASWEDPVVSVASDTFGVLRVTSK